MKNKNKLIIPLVLISSILALIIYLIKGSTSIGCFFLIIPSIYLAIETNIYFRNLKIIIWRLIFLIIQFFILIAFYSRMGGNGFLSFLADFLLLYFIFQLGESLYLLLRGSFQKTIKKKYGVVSLIILVLIIIGIPLSINRQIKTDKIINMAPLEVPQAAFDCTTETIKLYQQNDRKISTKQVDGGRLTWRKEKYNWMVFDCPEEDSTQRVFLLTSFDEKDQEKIIFSMEDERFDKVRIKDINKNGIPELIVQHTNLGNCWNCHGEFVFQIVGDEVKDMFSDWPIIEGYKYANVWVSESNNGGTDDILITDDSWEGHDGFSHADAPSHTIALTWKDGGYQRDEKEFLKYYLSNISKRDEYRKKIIKNPDTLLAEVISLAVEDYWDYKEIGKNDEGYAKFIINTSAETIPSNLIIEDSDKEWIEKIRVEIEIEYKAEKPTKIFLR